MQRHESDASLKYPPNAEVEAVMAAIAERPTYYDRPEDRTNHQRSRRITRYPCSVRDLLEGADVKFTVKIKPVSK